MLRDNRWDSLMHWLFTTYDKYFVCHESKYGSIWTPIYLNSYGFPAGKVRRRNILTFFNAFLTTVEISTSIQRWINVENACWVLCIFELVKCWWHFSTRFVKMVSISRSLSSNFFYSTSGSWAFPYFLCPFKSIWSGKR